MLLSALTGIEYNRLLALIVADLLLYRLVIKDKKHQKVGLDTNTPDSITFASSRLVVCREK